MNKVHFIDWGNVDYKEAWDRQEVLFKEKTDAKFSNRDLAVGEKKIIEHHLIFCEHPHVYTLGKSGSIENLLVDDDQLKQLNATYYPINRGGDITYHGPGQIVGYPILDLDQFFTDIHKYLRFLEEAIILTIAEYGLKGERYEGFTGVWLDVTDAKKARKICAMGVRCSRWVTMHGFAFNVNTDLSYFKNIVPCGIDDKAVTSLQKELGKEMDIEEVKSKLKKHLADLFEMELV
ncbi:MAG: lipoyl(octanoyl) transferase LipB [Bacteroidia bacterium]